MKSKEEILANIANDLNVNERDWTIDIVGNQIVAYWKWKDVTYLSMKHISGETGEFKFIVTLLDDGTWTESTVSDEEEKGAHFFKGTLEFNKSISIGNETKKHFEFGFGKKKDEGEYKFQKTTFNSTNIKQPIREYLEQCGWRKQ